MANGSPRVLLVDDDVKLVGLLERSLRFEGFEVVCAHTGDAALTALRQREPDLVLLDIGMPERDGLGVLRETRQISDVAVVMLTARDEVRDKVGALDLGADDYVAKPFDIDELVARMRAVLRRRGKPALDRLSYADVQLDLGRREASRDGRELALTATEFDMLAHLLRHPRQVLSRPALHRAVWGYDTHGDSNVVDVHVGHLRRKLGEPPIIHTVRGVGFSLRSQP
jgi:DNA-binding response OmpR family regulator